MPYCPECRNEVRGGQPFCGKCGTAIPSSPPLPEVAPTGSSRIDLDGQLVNRLLELFVNRPDGPQCQLCDGRLHLQKGPLALAIDPIQLTQVAQMRISQVGSGSLGIQIEQLRLGSQGLRIDLKLQG